MNGIHNGARAFGALQLNASITTRSKLEILLKALLPWLGVLIFLVVFFFYPLARILWVGLNPVSLHAIPSNSFLVARQVVLFTLYQSILSTLLTLAFGLPVAFLFARYDFSW